MGFNSVFKGLKWSVGTWSDNTHIICREPLKSRGP